MPTPLASITGVDAPSSANSGSTVAVYVYVKNIGDLEVPLWAQIMDRDTNLIVGQRQQSSIIGIGGTKTFIFYLTQADKLWLLEAQAAAGLANPVQSTYGFQIQGVSPPHAFAHIAELTIPREVVPGAKFDVVLGVENTGTAAGRLYARIADDETGAWLGNEQYTAAIDPGWTVYLYWRGLTMPDKNLVLRVQTSHVPYRTPSDIDEIKAQTIYKSVAAPATARIDAATWTPQSPKTGETVIISILVTNIGGSGKLWCQVVDSAANLIGYQLTGTPISPNTSVTFSFQPSAPTPGNWDLKATAAGEGKTADSTREFTIQVGSGTVDEAKAAIDAADPSTAPPGAVQIRITLRNAGTASGSLWCEVVDRDTNTLIAPRQTTSPITPGSTLYSFFNGTMPNKAWNLRANAGHGTAQDDHKDWTISLPSPAHATLDAVDNPSSSYAGKALQIRLTIRNTGETGPLWSRVSDRETNKLIAPQQDTSPISSGSTLYAFYNVNMPDNKWYLRAEAGHEDMLDDYEDFEIDLLQVTGPYSLIEMVKSISAAREGLKFTIEVTVKNSGGSYGTCNVLIVDRDLGTVVAQTAADLEVGEETTLPILDLTMPDHDWHLRAQGDNYIDFDISLLAEEAKMSLRKIIGYTLLTAPVVIAGGTAALEKE